MPIAPTLILGLGGTGSKIVEKVAEKVRESGQQPVGADRVRRLRHRRQRSGADPPAQPGDPHRSDVDEEHGRRVSQHQHQRARQLVPVNEMLNRKTLTEGQRRCERSRAWHSTRRSRAETSPAAPRDRRALPDRQGPGGAVAPGNHHQLRSPAVPVPGSSSRSPCTSRTTCARSTRRPRRSRADSSSSRTSSTPSSRRPRNSRTCRSTRTRRFANWMRS